MERTPDASDTAIIRLDLSYDSLEFLPTRISQQFCFLLNLILIEVPHTYHLFPSIHYNLVS